MSRKWILLPEVFFGPGLENVVGPCPEFIAWDRSWTRYLAVPGSLSPEKDRVLGHGSPAWATVSAASLFRLMSFDADSPS